MKLCASDVKADRRLVGCRGQLSSGPGQQLSEVGV